MKKRFGAVAIVMTLCAGFICADAGEMPGSAGRVDEVTLYRGQALVTRSVPIEGPEGRVEFEVLNLPQRVVSDSLFAEASEGIDVRAVRYRTQAVREEPRQEVRDLDKLIEETQIKMATNKKMQQLVEGRVRSLEKLEGFTAPTAKVEMSKGVLDVKALEQITQFIFDERRKAAEEELKLENEERELKEQSSLLEARRRKLTSSGSRTVRSAVLFLEKRNGGKGEVRLNYLVQGAGWSPSYNFRAGDDGEQVNIEYNALVQQMSGENWNDVKLTLSTASPSLTAQGPDLAPFRVALAQSAPRQTQQAQTSISQQLKGLRGRQKRAREQQNKAQVLSDNMAFNWDLNVVANDFQQLELNAGKDVVQAIQQDPALSDEGPSVSYQLAGTVSLASRSDQQMLRIARTKLDSELYHVATPILTSYVYREVELKNTAEHALLAGPVSVYLNGDFVGRGEIPTVARGQTFVMGFGADPQLRVRRELVEKDERIQGGNREVSFKYDLVVENYKDTAVPIRLMDRIPEPDRKADIRVTLTDIQEDELSEDELYLQTGRPKGILRWDIEVPAGASGGDAVTISYSYKLELAKAMQLTSPTKGRMESMKQEFFEMRNRKLLH